MFVGRHSDDSPQGDTSSLPISIGGRAFDNQVWVALNSKGDDPKPVPLAYKNYLIMKHMGWTWKELCDTPWEVVNSCWSYSQTEAIYERQELERRR